MAEKIKNKTYTVADLYQAAGEMVRDEMSAIKNRPLTPVEESKTKELARVISQSVLKEMRLV